MTSPSSHLFLILLLLSHLFISQSYAMRIILQGSDIKGERELPSVLDLAQKLSEVEGGDDDIQRKELHEVHSGPNPISNSIPPQWRKTKFEGKP